MPPLPSSILRGEKQLGTFGALGGMMRIEAVPTPERVAFGLLKLAGYVENTGPPMLAATRIAQTDMQQHFETDTDPEGNPWTALDPEYQVKKARMGGDPNNILTLTGALERAATSGAAWLHTGDSLFFSTAPLPPYWDVHQSGSDEDNFAGFAQDARERHAAEKKSGVKLTADSGGSPHDSLGIGRGKATPARPFIGLSAEAAAQIVELFDLWFDEGITLYVTKTGFVQQRIGGRFGPRIFPNFGA